MAATRTLEDASPSVPEVAVALIVAVADIIVGEVDVVIYAVLLISLFEIVQTSNSSVQYVPSRLQLKFV